MIIQYRRYDLNSIQTMELESIFNSCSLNHRKSIAAHKFWKEERKEKIGRFSIQMEWEFNENLTGKLQAEAYRKLIDFIEPISPNRQGNDKPRLIYQEK